MAHNMMLFFAALLMATATTMTEAKHRGHHSAVDRVSQLQQHAALQVSLTESILVQQNGSVRNGTDRNASNASSASSSGERATGSSLAPAGGPTEVTPAAELAPSAPMLALNIATDKYTLVHSGSCRKGCRPSDAVVSSTFAAYAGAGASLVDGSLLVGVEAVSMDTNLLPSVTVTAPSPLPVPSNASLPTETSMALVLPPSRLASGAQFRLNNTCRGTGTVIVHLRFAAVPPGLSEPAPIPVHVFLKTVCNVPTPSCEGIDCGIHGICAGSGTCDCEEGYSGLECQVGPGLSDAMNATDSTPAPCAALSFCSGNGECIDNEVCACDAGWGGRMCQVSTQDDELCATLSFCRGRGKCVSTGEGQYECRCDEGFEGDDCGTVSVDACPSACSGHGLCVDGKCECHLGFRGDDCSKAYSPCGGCLMGECVESSEDGVPTCLCDTEWTGPHCTIYVPAADPCAATSFCSGQGACASPLDSPPACVCAPGFSGVLCESVVEAGCKSGCGGYGTCDVMSDTCLCSKGRAGEACEKTACPIAANDNGFGVSCSGNGVCRGTPLGCLCADPFFGPACQNANCNASVLCSAHGTCKKSAGLALELCECKEGWMGPRCNQPDPSAANASDDASDDTIDGEAARLSLADQGKLQRLPRLQEKPRDIYEDSELDVY